VSRSDDAVPVSLGDGGAVTTSRKDIDNRIRSLRDGARGPGHVSREPALNARLDEIQACFLRTFLPRLRERNDERRRLAALYCEALSGCPGIEPVKQRAGSVYHLFVIRAKRREALRKHLAQHGIATSVHYPVPLHLQPAFRDCGLKRGSLPQAERACREILSLPLWPGMPGDAVLETAQRIRAFYSF
jgi:dTDP-3-amino-3,4,6-trideoxy-alpha-D-glucose transaminase